MVITKITYLLNLILKNLKFSVKNIKLKMSLNYISMRTIEYVHDVLYISNKKSLKKYYISMMTIENVNIALDVSNKIDLLKCKTL